MRKLKLLVNPLALLKLMIAILKVINFTNLRILKKTQKQKTRFNLIRKS